MRKALFVLLITLMNSPILVAQNLTMGQLLEIKKKDLGNVDDYLIARGWEFLEASESTLDNLGSADYAFEKDNMSSRASSFLWFYYGGHYSDITRLKIQVHKKEKYMEYLNVIKGFGCKMISSRVQDGRIIKVYRGATTTFEVRSSTSKNFFDEESAVWTFFIVSNDDYDLNFYTEE